MHLKACLSALNRAYALPLGRGLIALALALALFFAAACITDVTFYHNDDTNIAFALSGCLSGEPYPSHPFINCILGNIVSFCYRCLPGVPWWLVFQLVFGLLGLAVTGACILGAAYRKGLPLLAALVLYGCFALGCALYTLLLVTFTLTAALLGTAAAALILTADDLLSKKERALRFSFSALLLAGAFLFRNSSGLSLLPFYFGALCFYAAQLFFGKAGKQRLVSVAAFAALSLALAFGLVAVNNFGLAAYNAPEFTEFEDARGRFLDYPVDSYSNNPALYEAVGWNAELYSMVKQWFYMDERVTANALNAILDGSTETSFVGFSQAASDFETLYDAQPLVPYLLFLTVLLALAPLPLCVGRKESRLALLFMLCMLLGGGALVLYLLIRGRLVLRAFQLIAIPTGACVLLLGLCALPERSEAIAQPKRHMRLRTLAACALLLPALFCAYKCARIAVGYDSSQALCESRALMQYVIDHPENVYIRDTRVANNIDAVTTYPDQKPTNLLDWGGTSAYTGAKQLQIEQNGLTPFTADVFFRDGVYFVSEPDSRDYKSFVSYLNAVYGSVSLVPVDEIAEDITVYRVTRAPMEEPA